MGVLASVISFPRSLAELRAHRLGLLYRSGNAWHALQSLHPVSVCVCVYVHLSVHGCGCVCVCLYGWVWVWVWVGLGMCVCLDRS